MRTHKKEPLYRKVNTKTYGVGHRHGSDYSENRHTKKDTRDAMKKGVERGLDYTPLFRFLLSKVGKSWSLIHSEAVARLDREEPIFWLVAKDIESGEEFVRTGESSYFSGLYIDGDGLLQVVEPSTDHRNFKPLCACCTHTFNGVLCTQRYAPDLLNKYLK